MSVGRDSTDGLLRQFGRALTPKQRRASHRNPARSFKRTCCASSCTAQPAGARDSAACGARSGLPIAVADVTWRRLVCREARCAAQPENSPWPERASCAAGVAVSGGVQPALRPASTRQPRRLLDRVGISAFAVAGCRLLRRAHPIISPPKRETMNQGAAPQTSTTMLRAEHEAGRQAVVKPPPANALRCWGEIGRRCGRSRGLRRAGGACELRGPRHRSVVAARAGALRAARCSAQRRPQAPGAARSPSMRRSSADRLKRPPANGRGGVLMARDLPSHPVTDPPPMLRLRREPIPSCSRSVGAVLRQRKSRLWTSGHAGPHSPRQHRLPSRISAGGTSVRGGNGSSARAEDLMDDQWGERMPRLG